MLAFEGKLFAERRCARYHSRCISVLLFIFNMYKCITSGTLRDAPIVLRLCRDGSAYFILLVCSLGLSFIAILTAKIRVLGKSTECTHSCTDWMLIGHDGLVTLIISTLVSFKPDLILLNAAKNL